MIHINVVCVGKIKEKYLKEAIDEYSKRLSKYCKLNIIEIQDESLPNKINENTIEEVKIREGEKILETLRNSSYIVSLDLKGKQYTSEEFADKIEKISTRGFGEISFIIGGTLGLDKRVLNSSNELICFSNMTFPHQLIRVFLLEQLFRSFKILNNETYHW